MSSCRAQAAPQAGIVLCIAQSIVQCVVQGTAWGDAGPRLNRLPVYFRKNKLMSSSSWFAGLRRQAGLSPCLVPSVKENEGGDLA